jgi:hypothetical protein
LKENLNVNLKLAWAFMVVSSQINSNNFGTSRTDSNLGESSASQFSDLELTLANDSSTWNHIVNIIDHFLAELAEIS